MEEIPNIPLSDIRRHVGEPEFKRCGCCDQLLEIQNFERSQDGHLGAGKSQWSRREDCLTCDPLTRPQKQKKKQDRLAAIESVKQHSLFNEKGFKMNEEMRQCIQCSQVLPINKFDVLPKVVGRTDYICKTCHDCREKNLAKKETKRQAEQLMESNMRETLVSNSNKMRILCPKCGNRYPSEFYMSKTGRRTEFCKHCREKANTYYKTTKSTVVQAAAQSTTKNTVIPNCTDYITPYLIKVQADFITAKQTIPELIGMSVTVHTTNGTKSFNV